MFMFLAKEKESCAYIYTHTQEYQDYKFEIVNFHELNY